MAEAIQAGVQAAFTANATNAANAGHQQRNNRHHNPVLEEQDHESDADNPFGDDVNNRHQQQYCGHQNINGDDARWASCIKLDIPEFHGGAQPEDLLDRLVIVDEFLEFKDVFDNRQVSLVTTRLCGHATSWWNQLNLSCN